MGREIIYIQRVAEETERNTESETRESFFGGVNFPDLFALHFCL